MQVQMRLDQLQAFVSRCIRELSSILCFFVPKQGTGSSKQVSTKSDCLPWTIHKSTRWSVWRLPVGFIGYLRPWVSRSRAPMVSRHLRDSWPGL